ncbi:hypothetical protein NFO65_11410 [Neorhizobium galegae]|uniref:hypothetical protein n=1 Tax=Neorhizobium galegae TaxID=399 RepID=UPI0006217014|nr:hypothetical protein [Neorhizobium galegae]MCQ1571353.1 hypothetical protein [Neorhizobium galegae]CDZ60832.1 Hypothetical protein NGAL_HAMBI2605_12200 [Neorhizobium galegae bv. orientalis]CDZ69466.1 Hypothetical protein NGAL_HAMBI2610_10650 [Neorhizobium galegae bv. orientalis]
MKKIIVSALILAATCTSIVVPAGEAAAQQWDRHHDRYDRYDRYDRRGPPPPPRRHRNNDGAIIAGGLAAGVIGGLIGGALANDGGPRYIDPPPPPRPRCWFEDRRVRNAYDGGWHMESLRVCQ